MSDGAPDANTDRKRSPSPSSAEQGPLKKPKLESSNSQETSETSPLVQRTKQPARDYRKRHARVEPKPGEEKAQRLPKKKCVCLIGYCGTGMSGSQINPGVKTIEGEIFEALCKAGCVSQDNSIDPQKVSLARCARTDAGVHAAVNCISLKMILTPNDLPEPKDIASLTDYINSFLPDTIRIWRVTRVQNAFNPRAMCDSRCYDYLLPTYVFVPPKPTSFLGKALAANGLEVYQDFHLDGAASDIDLENVRRTAAVKASQFWSALSHIQSTEKEATEVDETRFKQEMNQRRKWRIASSPELLDDLKTAAKMYEGNHNFHNFTVQKEFHDRSAHRNMKSLKISEPFLVGDSEWISIKIHGQSFMLHQIRKMIGLLVMIVRSKVPASLIPETFGPSKIHVPKAPSLGLLLEKPLFTQYNKRLEESNKQLERSAAKKAKKEAVLGAAAAANDGDEQAQKDKIEYDGAFQAQVDEFKQAFIYDKLYADELRQGQFAKFLNLLDVYPGPDFGYLNKRGEIPTSCIFVNGKLPGSKQADGVDLLNEEEEEDRDLNKDADEG